MDPVESYRLGPEPHMLAHRWDLGVPCADTRRPRSGAILVRMPGPREIEIKFVLSGIPAMERRLRRAGFHCLTPRTHEMDTLYDLPSRELRKRGEVLRLREYGGEWTLTHKSKGTEGRHKSRIENELTVSDGAQAENILSALGYRPSFRYEKFRSEWTDGAGHVVLDETPIGNFGEIEGPPRWIDRTARALDIGVADYITGSYVWLFLKWKERTGSPAEHMTFRDVGTPGRARGPRRRE
jgi:adenylate cyclase class 2